jgi:RimJ/RimL family protein N-acetyltransferase
VEGAAEGAYVDLAIVDPADESVLLGGVILHSFDWRHMHTEVGFWLAPAARGAGVATEATALCVDWAFRELGMHRVEMTTLTGADRVLALADRLGFHREGVMRERNLERGRRLDIVMYAVLQEEWPSPLN